MKYAAASYYFIIGNALVEHILSNLIIARLNAETYGSTPRLGQKGGYVIIHEIGAGGTHERYLYIFFIYLKKLTEPLLIEGEKIVIKKNGLDLVAFALKQYLINEVLNALLPDVYAFTAKRVFNDGIIAKTAFIRAAAA